MRVLYAALAFLLGCASPKETSESISVSKDAEQSSAYSGKKIKKFRSREELRNQQDRTLKRTEDLYNKMTKK